ncbi:MAG: glycosyltransferase family 4 protein [Thermotogota bacterium]|nr:glycosyltransferase family 4 protein [Thermotogota bacterium]
MKVLMLTPSYDPIIGGTETVVKNLAINLNKIGVETDVMTFNMDKKWNPIWKWEVKEEDGFKVYRIPAINPFMKLKLPNAIGFFFKINTIPSPGFWKIIKDYDILHFHDEVDLTFPLFSYFVRKPKVFHCHTLQNTHSFYKKNILCRTLFTGCADYFLGSSRSALELILDLGINKRTIAVIPNSVDLSRFQPIGNGMLEEYAQRFNLGMKTKKIVCVSRLSPDKLDPVVHAINAMPRIVQRVPDAQLIIVGGGSCFDRISELSGRTNKQLDRDAIILSGVLDEDDVPILINLADVVIGVGQVPVEAMAIGKTAIVAGHVVGSFGGNFGGIVTKKNVNALKAHNFSGRNSTEKTNPDRIAEATLKLLTDDKYRRSVGEFGKKFVGNERDINKIAKQLEIIYHDIIKNRRSCLNGSIDSEWQKKT